MDKFINKLNFNFISNQQILKLIANIDGFKGKWNFAEKHENKYLKELRKRVTGNFWGSE